MATETSKPNPTMADLVSKKLKPEEMYALLRAGHYSHPTEKGAIPMAYIVGKKLKPEEMLPLLTAGYFSDSENGTPRKWIPKPPLQNS